VAVGTWGVGVFSSDGALDVRGSFRELIGAGYSVEDATARVIDEHGLGDQLECDAEWVALAVTQWKAGRLLDRVRDRAIEVIDAGPREDWQPRDARRRRVVLAKTRTQLLSQQPAPTRIRPERRAQSPFVPGDLLRFTCTSGREVALWAIANSRHEGLTAVSVNTRFQLIAIGDPALPPMSELIEADPIVLTPGGGPKQLWLVMPQDAVGPQWQLLGNYPFPADGQRRNETVVEPKKADAVFEAWYAHRVAADRATVAMQRLADAFPDLPPTERSNPRGKAIQIGQHVADLLALGKPDRVRGMLAALEDVIADGNPPAVAPVIDTVLTIATHPESGLARQDALAALGPRALELVADIDRQWETRQIVKERPPRLDGKIRATDSHAEERDAWNARSTIRRLPDGRYALPAPFWKQPV
jgi:hypothetical protein